MAKLTDKQEMFCREYLVDLNAAQAAIRAGYSKSTAKDIGCQNLAKLNIIDFIAELKAARVERVEVKADDIVKQLDEYRRANIADYVELVTEPTTVISKEGVETTPEVQVLRFKDFKDLTDEQKRCIESIKQGKNGIELKLHGTEWSVEKLNRHIDFYNADNSSGNKILLTNQDREGRISELLAKAKNG